VRGIGDVARYGDDRGPGAASLQGHPGRIQRGLVAGVDNEGVARSGEPGRQGPGRARGTRR